MCLESAVKNSPGVYDRKNDSFEKAGNLLFVTVFYLRPIWNGCWSKGKRILNRNVEKTNHVLRISHSIPVHSPCHLNEWETLNLEFKCILECSQVSRASGSHDTPHPWILSGISPNRAIFLLYKNITFQPEIFRCSQLPLVTITPSPPNCPRQFWQFGKWGFLGLSPGLMSPHDATLGGLQKCCCASGVTQKPPFPLCYWNFPRGHHETRLLSGSSVRHPLISLGLLVPQSWVNHTRGAKGWLSPSFLPHWQVDFHQKNELHFSLIYFLLPLTHKSLIYSAYISVSLGSWWYLETKT